MLHPWGQDLGDEGEEVRAGEWVPGLGWEGHRGPDMGPSLSSVFPMLASLGRQECR